MYECASCGMIKSIDFLQGRRHMMNKPLRFNIELGRTKPVNIRNEQVRCPFCDRSKLTDILDTSGHIIWLMNKYPV